MRSDALLTANEVTFQAHITVLVVVRMRVQGNNIDLGKSVGEIGFELPYFPLAIIHVSWILTS
eukprot:6472419-Amphidinium_carterae.1